MSLADIAIGVTIFLVVVGYILAPVGLVAVAGVNRTSAGITAGTTNGNMWDAFIPIVLATIVISVVYFLKNSAN
jgi:hypothetical protein